MGLGNPGGEYSGTRHNVGFEVVRVLSERHKIVLKTRRFEANFGTGRIGDTEVVLVRPMTFMNLSGRAVGALARHFNVPADRTVVVFDEMDLPVARVQGDLFKADMGDWQPVETRQVGATTVYYWVVPERRAAQAFWITTARELR